MPLRPLTLGNVRPIGAAAGPGAAPFDLPAHHLVTHGVIVGMTGSGKTGLAMVIVEEALRSRIPVLMIDVKGDLPNLLLTMAALAPSEFEPWIDADAAHRRGLSTHAVAEETANRWRDGLRTWGLGPSDVTALRDSIAARIITPGTSAGESLHILSALETASPLWESDEESAREALSSSISLVLRLIERDPDPARSRDHVVLAHLAERRLRAKRSAGLSELLADLANPPISAIGVLTMDDFLPPRDRQALAQELNTLLASPTFASWQKGSALDIASWLKPKDGKTPAVIVSVAHLDDDERGLVLGLLFDQLLAWVRGLSGTSDLRALVVFDEVFGFLPPHPANPPAKRPLLSLLKQARAFGVGLVLATQNPMDLDYKALSNAGVWCVGRLQTDADRERVVEGLASSEAGATGVDSEQLASTLKTLPPRTFFVRDVHGDQPALLLETRWTLSWLRGPMTRQEIRKLAHGNDPPRAPAPAPRSPVASEASSPAPPATEARAIAGQPPRSPDTWRTYFAPLGDTPTPGFRYGPNVIAVVTEHMRDGRRGIAITRERVVRFPIESDGRVETTQAVETSRDALASAPVEGARFDALPDALFRKMARAACERVIREHVYRTSSVAVGVHDELNLAQRNGETGEVFAQRCRTEALRLAEADAAQVDARFTSKLARAADRLALARGELANAESESAASVGAVGEVLIGIVAGRRTARKLEGQRTRANTRLERARAGVARAEAAHRAQIEARDEALRHVQQRAESAPDGIAARSLVPRKSDIEVAEIGILWTAVV